MSAFDHCRNVYDVALKPRLLRTLLRESVPHAKRPLGNPSELSSIFHTVRIHRLLSELFPEFADRKLVDSWKSAVDCWMDRILSLVSSDVQENCWAGVCLLGMTCGECSTGRFLASYSVWFNELLSHIQSSSSLRFVKVASCASTSDLLTRLGGFESAKKDATSYAGRVVQPILKLLNEDGAAVEWEVAVHLLCTSMVFFPSAISRHYESVENTVVSRIVSGNCSPNLLKKLACCLALLPKSRGNEESWSMMMRKILLSISVHLDDVLEGLEEESKRFEAVGTLVPPGTDPPPPLGAQMVVGAASSKVVKRSKQSLTPIISTLMLCSCTLLTSSYPVQVTVPVHPILAIIRRVLMVDGSLPESLQPFTTSLQQEFVCSQLHVLHQYSLELLTYTLNGIRSQLLPHAADIVRLLTHYSKKCSAPELRIKIYSIIRILLVTLGAGTALYLAQEIVNMASIDLNSGACLGVATSPTRAFPSSSELIAQPCQKKRKHGSASKFPEVRHDASSLDVETTKDCSMLISLKIAALEALEALLTVGGALRADSWRSNIDSLLIKFAINNCRKGWANEESIFTPKESKRTWSHLQLAALRALLASLLAPACVRPLHLSQGLQIFREGKLTAGAKIAEFCANALLALELLIHPRALPLFEFRPPNMNSFGGPLSKLQGSTDFLTSSHKLPLQGGEPGVLGIGVPDTEKDYLEAIYMETEGKDFEVPVSKSHATPSSNKKQIETSLKDQDLEKSHSAYVIPSPDEQIAKRIKVSESGKNSNEKIDSKHTQQLGQSSSREGVTDSPLLSGSSGVKKQQVKAVLEATSDAVNGETTTSTGKAGPSGLSSVSKSEQKEIIITRADDGNPKLYQINTDDDDSSSDSFPSVIDDDDDSDDDSVSQRQDSESGD